MKRNNDITISKNMIGGRQGWAYICNSMKFAVLKVDLDKKSEYEDSDFVEYGDVKVVKKYKDGFELPTVCSFVRCDGEYELLSGGCCLSARFNFTDAMKSVEEANLNVVRENDVVALASYSNNLGAVVLSLYRIGKVDIHCMTVAKLVPLTDEEMKAVKTDADAWCNR